MDTDHFQEIPYNYLYYFSVIAAEGNLTRAAERLYKTQPSLSTAMKKLEAQLGYPLFEHQSNKLVLNEAGRCLLEYVSTGLGYFEDGIRAARKISDSGNRLQVATSMGIVRLFASEYEQQTGKKVSVKTCDTEEVVSRVLSGKADVGINFGYIQDIRITNRILMRGPYCIAVNAGHPLNQRQTVSIQELSEYQLFCSNIAHTYEKVRDLFEHAKCTCKLLVLDERDVLFKAAELGLGGVICLPMKATRNRGGADVEFIPVTGCDSLASAVLIMKRGSYYSEEVNHLMHFLGGKFHENQLALNEELARRNVAFPGTLEK